MSLRFKSNLFRSNRRSGSRAIAKVGYILALFGGLLITAFSIAALLSYPLQVPFHSPLSGYLGIGVIPLVLGIVTVFGSRLVNELVWAIVLMIVAFLSGGIGGLLTLLGGLLGLLSRYA